jgi:hypothetical protein
MILNACEPKNPHEQTIRCDTFSDTTFQTKYCKFSVIEIDGCEYIIGRTTGRGTSMGYMSHKGNCKYCEQRRKQQK